VVTTRAADRPRPSREQQVAELPVGLHEERERL